MERKEKVFEILRESGCRITSQREILIDIILSHECSSCKEIHYLALKQDERIGIATVYRMLTILEEHGILKRKVLYELEL